MIDWTSHLKYSPYNLRFSSSEVAVRYLFDIDIIGQSKLYINDIWTSPPAQRILKKQGTNGSWKYPTASPKAYPNLDYDLYQTINKLAQLVEIYKFNKSSPELQRTVEYILSKQSTRGDIRQIYANQYSPNYSAMVAELLIKAGYEEDIRVIKILDWLLASRQQDGGWAIPFRTQGLSLKAINLIKTIEADYARPSSAMITGVVLRAMSIHPKFRSKSEIKQAGLILAKSLFTADAYPDRKNKLYWTKFGFPFMYTDLVSALDSLSLIGGFNKHPNVQEALAWLKDRQTKEGLFELGITMNDKTGQSVLTSVAVYRIFKRFYSRN